MTVGDIKSDADYSCMYWVQKRKINRAAKNKVFIDGSLKTRGYDWTWMED